MLEYCCEAVQGGGDWAVKVLAGVALLELVSGGGLGTLAGSTVTYWDEVAQDGGGWTVKESGGVVLKLVVATELAGAGSTVVYRGGVALELVGVLRGAQERRGWLTGVEGGTRVVDVFLNLYTR